MRASRRAVLVLAAAAACAAAAEAKPAPKVYTATIRDLAFGGMPQGARVGDTIEWVNADLFRHTATARDRSFDVDLAPKAHGRTVLKKPGALVVYCRFHPGMTATLHVVR